jgi:hypothetical protein
MVMAAIPGERGCGQRKCGGIYGECGLSPWGKPLEDFLMDPPVAVDPTDLGISPIGVTLIDDPATGATHILDWVGEEHYPNVCDALEEVRRFGLSRRLSRTLDFGRLDANSRILLVHRRALITDVAAYVVDWRRSCPKAVPEHADPPHAPSLCAGIWWEDVGGGQKAAPQDGQPADARRVRRAMPSFSYVARSAPLGATPAYAPAIFASFPLSRLVVVRDPEGATHRTALDRAGQASLPVDLEDR